MGERAFMGRLFLRLFFVVSAQVAPREDDLCGWRYSSVHHREVGVSRSDLRRAQGRTARTWPLRSRWLGQWPRVCKWADSITTPITKKWGAGWAYWPCDDDEQSSDLQSNRDGWCLL